MRRKKSIAPMGLVLVGLVLGGSAYGERAGVLANVSLVPAGSFAVSSASLSGSGVKQGQVYSASELTLPVSSLKTGMSLRDEHLMEKLSSAEHPNIIVKDIKAQDGTGTATLTLKGITKPVAFKFDDLGQGLAKASFTLNLADFKVDGISYKGVGVEDEVEVIATVAYVVK